MIRMPRISVYTVVMAILLAAAALAENAADVDLPIGLTDEEILRLDQIGLGHRSTSPPPGPVRACAEWEPSTGVLIRWPLGISVALVAEMSEDVTVFTLVADESRKNQAIASYTAGGVVMTNAEFIIASTNSIWTRDYGPWFIIDGGRQPAMIDHIYNRPRPQDDSIPTILGDFWEMDVYGMGLIHAGGNHMTDGLGRSFSTELVYDENPGLSSDQVDSIMMEYLGNQYFVLNYVESGGIHHIDCWAKLLNPATILVKDVPVDDYSHDLLDARAGYLAGLTGPWGVPYTIIRIYCPPGTAYTNSLILNDKVLVPIFGSDFDTTAVRIYEEAMPGYEILGFTGSWYDNDAIHCRAMGITDDGMLYIEHTPLLTTGDTLNDHEITARIVPYSGQDLIADSLKVYVRTDGGPYQSVPLSPTMAADSFCGYIPPQPGGTTVEYYLQAADNSGRVETHPYIGASWAHTFYVNGPPQITDPDSLFLSGDSAFIYYPEFTDVDDTIITIEYTDIPEWASVVNDTLIGTTPAAADTSGFSLMVSDPYNTAIKQITLIIDYNHPPLIVSPDSFAVAAASPFNYCPEISDPDDSQLTIIYSDYPDWLAVNDDTLTGITPDSAVTAGFTVEVADSDHIVSQTVILAVYLCGDANSDRTINVGDAVYLINYVFKSGPSPNPIESGDANGDDEVNVGDAVYLINHIFKSGNPPDC